jgi:L-cysteine S-thiosulfotransferase
MRKAWLGLGAVFLASWAAAQSSGDTRRTGYQDMTEALQKMQDDDGTNPGMLFVQMGEALWGRKAGTADKACADCHTIEAMRGVAARYPAIPPKADKPVDLEGRINLCVVRNQGAEALKAESEDLLALTALVAQQSRGLPIDPPNDLRLRVTRAAGAKIFSTRQGQLNLSCANCHDDNAGRKLAGATIPQAHPTGYPIYRLEWQTLGSLKRRLRGCLVGIRAEGYDYGAPELVALEAYLMERARGMKLEGIGIRP